MNNCIVLVGPTASGKTTLARELERRGYGRIITYTTRPMRQGEIDGVHYHFITIDEFKKKIGENFFAEWTSYDASFGYCMYGSAKEDYNSENKTCIILNPEGVMTITEDAFIVYLDIRESILKERAIKRGDSIEEIDRRIEEDKKYFYAMLKIKKMDLTINAPNDVEYLADWIIDLLGDIESHNKHAL